LIFAHLGWRLLPWLLLPFETPVIVMITVFHDLHEAALDISSTKYPLASMLGSVDRMLIVDVLIVDVADSGFLSISRIQQS